MHMAATTRLWTVDEVHELPDDGNRYEVVDGELLVTPAPAWRHQDAVLALAGQIGPWLRDHPVGRLLIAPADVVTGARTLVQPDLFVVPLVDGRKPRDWSEAGRLLLAVEVLSPSSARGDRFVKRRLYQSMRVPEYWLVDVDARAIERWTPTDDRAELLDAHLTWRPDPAHPALDMELPALFAEVLGE